MKRILALLIAFLMILPSSACFAETSTFTAEANGFGGPVTVTLTVEDGVITKATVVGDNETPNVGSRAIAILPGELVRKGTPDVDAVAGCTMSSNAVIQAAKEAYAQATGKNLPAEVKMAPGTYEEVVWGYSQPYPLPVKVTVSENTIEAIDVPKGFEELDQHGETLVIFQTVIDYLIPRILDNQSFAVDAVTGATVSSNAVKQAVRLALAEALAAGGSDPDAIAAFDVIPEKTEEGETEEIDVDVVGVGLGNSGIMAAVRLVETLKARGYDQTVSYLGIEKAAKIGGQSNMAHELFAINPEGMKKEFNDGNDYLDKERLRARWKSDTTNEAGVQKAKEDLIDLYIDRTGEVIDWLHFDHGYEFEAPKVGDIAAAAQEEKFVGTFNLIKFDYSYELRRDAVLKWAKGMMDQVCEAGGSYMLETEGYELLYDEGTGCVTGVKARNLVTGKEYIIHAKAVIMATGGFGGGKLTNTLYSNEYYPLQGDYFQFGMHQNDGKMIQAALNIGAGGWNLGMPGILNGLCALGQEIHDYPVEQDASGAINNRTGRIATKSINDIPEGFIAYNNVMYFNDDGNRFHDEYKIGNSVGNEPNQYYYGGSHYYVLIDDEQVKEVQNSGFPKGTRWRPYTSQGGVAVEVPQPQTYEVMQTAIDMGLVFKGDTIEALAEQVGVDPGALRASFDRYNELCDKGVDEDFGKDPSRLRKYAENGPYYAVEAFPYTYGSCGGLDVDTSMRVLKTDHETVIGGLYASGGDSLGVLMSDERNYLGFGGIANGWAYFSGFIAGASVGNFIADSMGL